MIFEPSSGVTVRRGKPAWRNWAGNCSRSPVAVARPETTEGVVEAVREAAARRRALKAVGGSHSFTDIAATDGIVATTDRLTGLIAADPETGLVTLRAGTRLHDIPALLEPHGLALANMGDVDRQSLAGALSTSTHGTGLGFPGFGATVRALTIVLADGSAVRCSPSENAALFEAARVGLGALGIITEITIQCVPRFFMRAVERPERLVDVVESFTERSSREDHYEFYWFPGTDTALTKANTRLLSPGEGRPVSAVERLVGDELVSNAFFSLTCQVGARVHGVIPAVNRLANRLVSERTYTDVSHRVFVSPRRVRFREMEYALPFENAEEILRRVVEAANGFGEAISFPIEVRTSAADDVWMSTATGRRTLYVAAHRYHLEPHAEYFEALERVFWEFGGRPHWGKLHTLDAPRLAELYPRFGDFLEQRELADPEGRFLNPYLRRVLGV